MGQLVYHDTYSGPRWRYGMQNRPLAAFAVPKGWIIQSDRPHPDFRHGTVDYAHPLTDDDLYHFELTLVGEF